MNTLSTKDLEHILSKDDNFTAHNHGVYAINKLPTRLHYDSSLIINSDTHINKGRHWLSIYIPKDGQPEFFDPLGKCPSLYSHYLIDFLIEQNSRGFISNNRCLQPSSSSSCGKYCIYFLFHRIKGISFQHILNTFSTNLTNNEAIIEKFYSQCVSKPMWIHPSQYFVTLHLIFHIYNRHILPYSLTLFNYFHTLEISSPVLSFISHFVEITVLVTKNNLFITSLIKWP